MSFDSTDHGGNTSLYEADSFYASTTLAAISSVTTAFSESQTSTMSQPVQTSSSPQPSTIPPNISNDEFSVLFPFSTGLSGVNQMKNFEAINMIVAILLTTIFLVLICRFVMISHSWIRQLAIMGNPEHQAYWKTNRTGWWPWLKRHFFYAPLYHDKHSQEIVLLKRLNIGILPGRAKFTLLTIYILINLAWTLMLPYKSSKREIIAALRGSSGLIACVNLFPTIIFALRNNPLIPLLNISYDTFQLFHRWAGRVFIVESIIHTAAWVANTSDAGGIGAVMLGLTQGSHGLSYSWGMVASVAAFIILIQTISSIRHAFYEIFLSLHKLLVFLVLLGTLLHLKLDNLPVTSWLVLIIFIWSYEYAVRFYRIVVHNVTRYQKSSYVVVTALNSGACRITFNLPIHWKARPGTFIHMYLPQFAFMQSHPFSVAWVEDFDASHDTIFPSGSELPISVQDVEFRDEKSQSSSYQEQQLRSSVSLVVKAQGGFTRKLWNQVKAMDGQVCETYGYLEGFYGGHENLGSYGDVVLFAGGIGITHHIMFCKQLVEGYTKGTMACRRVTLIWTIPSKDCLEWVQPWMNEILAMENRQIVVSIRVYITRQKVEDRISDSGQTQLIAGRCPIDDILRGVIDTRKGAVAVKVCGPTAFADSVRTATRKVVEHGVIDFIEEAFTY